MGRQDQGHLGVQRSKDRTGIKAGEKYTREIINAIKGCDVFLLVLSSEWVPKELGKAIQYHKYIIPVKITEFEVTEFELQLDSLSEIQSQINLVNIVKNVLQLKPVGHQSSAQIPDEPSPRPKKGTGSSQTSPEDFSDGSKKNFLVGGPLVAMLAVGILSGWLMFGKKNQDAATSPEGQTVLSAGREAEGSDGGRCDSKKMNFQIRQKITVTERAGRHSHNPKTPENPIFLPTPRPICVLSI